MSLSSFMFISTFHWWRDPRTRNDVVSLVNSVTWGNLRSLPLPWIIRCCLPVPTISHDHHLLQWLLNRSAKRTAKIFLPTSLICPASTTISHRRRFPALFLNPKTVLSYAPSASMPSRSPALPSHRLGKLTCAGALLSSRVIDVTILLSSSLLFKYFGFHCAVGCIGLSRRSRMNRLGNVCLKTRSWSVNLMHQIVHRLRLS